MSQQPLRVIYLNILLTQGKKIRITGKEKRGLAKIDHSASTWMPLSLGSSLLCKWLDLLSEGDLFFIVFKLLSWVPHEWLDFLIVERSFCFHSLFPELFEPVYPVGTLYISRYYSVPAALEFWNKFCCSGLSDLENRWGGGIFAAFSLF